MASTPGGSGPTDRRRVLGVVGPVAVAAVVRVAYWALVTPDYVPRSDDAQYAEIAHNLAEGHGFAMHFPQLMVHPTAFRPPLYPGLLGGVYAVFGSRVGAGRVLNLLLGLVVVALAQQLAQGVAGRWAGIVCGLAVALYPPLVANDVVLLSEPLGLVILLGLALALQHDRILLAGVLCGLLLLERPSAQVTVIVVALWVLWRVSWKAALRLTLVAALVVAPWVVRNWIQLGAPVLVTSNGFNLAAMYSPQARASDSFVDPVFDPRFDDLRLAQFDEIVWQRELQRLALQELRRHPSRVAAIVRGNLAAEFELKPSFNTSAEELDGRNLTFRSWTLPLFYVVSLVGLAGLLMRWRVPIVQLLLAIVAASVVSSLLFVAPPRLRAPFDVLCCVGVGLAAERWRSRQPFAQGIAARRSRQSGQTGNFSGSRAGIHFLPHRAVISLP